MRNMNIDIQIRIVYTDRRAFLLLLHEIIHDRILRTISNKFGVIEIFRVDYRVDGKRLVQRHVVFPFHLFNLFIDSIGVFSFKVINRLQDTQCRTTIEVGFVKHFLISGKGNHPAANLNIVGT